MTDSTAKLGFAVALATLLIVLGLLVTGSPILLVPLGARLGLPLGNVITWFGMVALVMMIWFGSGGLRNPVTRVDRFYRLAWVVLLALAVLWPFVSYTLADNWSFSFGRREGFRGSSRAADWFFRYSYAVFLLPLLFAAMRIVHLGLERLRGKRSQGG